MKYLGLYFSGIGNTKIVCLKAKEELEKRGHHLDVVDVINDEVKSLDDYDALFIFYPIYGFNCPKPIIKYVKKIEKANKHIPCVIMKQSGEHLFWNNASSLYLTSLLKRRNIKVTNEYHYLMPYSFIFRHTDYMAYKMKTTMEGLLPLDLDDFLAGKEVHMKRFFLDRPFAFILRIQWWGGRFNGLFYKVKKDQCIKCMKCVNNCPAKNIKYDEEMYTFPAYIAIDGFGSKYEYALLNEKEHVITYLYLAYPGKDQFEKYPDYVKENHSSYNKSGLDCFTIYAHSFDGGRSYVEFDD